MLRNVEYSDKPERFIYQRLNGMAHITIADNIREGVNEQNEDRWFCDLYTLVINDTDNMAQRLERSYELFLAKAKAEAEREETVKKQSDEERIKQLQEQNSMLMECLLEMSEIVYA